MLLPLVLVVVHCSLLSQGNIIERRGGELNEPEARRLKRQAYWKSSVQKAEDDIYSRGTMELSTGASAAEDSRGSDIFAPMGAEGPVITDKEAISKEILRIDQAIANIDHAINSTSHDFSMFSKLEEAQADNKPSSDANLKSYGVKKDEYQNNVQSSPEKSDDQDDRLQTDFKSSSDISDMKKDKYQTDFQSISSDRSLRDSTYAANNADNSITGNEVEKMSEKESVNNISSDHSNMETRSHQPVESHINEEDKKIDDQTAWNKDSDNISRPLEEEHHTGEIQETQDWESRSQEGRAVKMEESVKTDITEKMDSTDSSRSHNTSDEGSQQPVKMEESVKTDIAEKMDSTDSSRSHDTNDEVSQQPLNREESDQMLQKFKKDSLEYKNHDCQPSDTRRMFDEPAGERQFKIASMSRLNFYAQRNQMGGNIQDRDELCSGRHLKCNPELRYRSFDGTCNNLEKPDLGSTQMPLRRLLRPAYTDGHSLPRGVTEYTESAGYVSTLPSPRKISDVVFELEGNETLVESKVSTHMVMQFGQFLAHDISNLAKESFDCCNDAIKNLERCFPISVPEDDSFYSVFGKQCLDFTRSDTHCSSKDIAEQFNKQTSFIDGSQVYGKDKAMAHLLRSKEGRGRMATNAKLTGFLPSKFDIKYKKSERDLPSDFVSGDHRVEVQASLTAIHVLFLKEHNRIADFLFEALKGKKGKSDKELDEFVYQETRRLVTASMQHITYTHYLPKVLGKTIVEALKLNHEDCIYEPKADPSIINSFSSAAFRYGHSLVQGIFRGENQPWRLGKFYGDSRFAWGSEGQDFVNELIGLSKQPSQKFDSHITKQMTQNLFANNKTAEGGGHDIGSINIQRGRDHGLPSYNEFRKFCSLAPIQSMNEKPSDMEQESWDKIVTVYRSVEEIDLYVGGLSETPTDGIVGPTFACIIGKQFRLLMDGDRFFYRHTEGPNIFPLEGAAFQEVKTRTLGDIICEATPAEEIPEDVFVQGGMMPCKDHKKMDLGRIATELEKLL